MSDAGEGGIAVSNIVERLRTTHECTVGFWAKNAHPEDRRILLEAADELEHLYAALDTADARAAVLAEEIVRLMVKCDFLREEASAHNNRATTPKESIP